ncbi:hypothetical protein E2C01_054513 [Portunus trituberculatus]|uniref:Uncharacterized protein n=1 Tax=Portunus trituberculatus TaxID=210409 RepID=A0A5B7GTW6_PORTR|nr:hypothetical protein [Portunus trituberculatus]
MMVNGLGKGAAVVPSGTHTAFKTRDSQFHAFAIKVRTLCISQTRHLTDRTRDYPTGQRAYLQTPLAACQRRVSTTSLTDV